MGRKMLKMERIANEKTRVTTYKKRKACLLKKAKEFSTLCGVDACLIIYGPTRTAAAAVAEAETWPRDVNKVHGIISKYRDTASSSCRKTFQVHDFLPRIDNNVESKFPATSKRAKYRTWDERLGKCSKEELCGILGEVEDKIRRAQELVGLLEETKRQSRALAEANQQAFCGYSYNHIEQQQLHQLLMMLSRHDGHGLFPGLYSGPEAYTGPPWAPENIVFNGADPLAGNWAFDPTPLQSSTQANKWEEDPSKDRM